MRDEAAHMAVRGDVVDVVGLGGAPAGRRPKIGVCRGLAEVQVRLVVAPQAVPEVGAYSSLHTMSN